MKQGKIYLSREDGLSLGLMFSEDPSLKLIELPIVESEGKNRAQMPVKYRSFDKIKHNLFMQRLNNSTFGLLFYGLAVTFACRLGGFEAGLIVTFVWCFVDLIFGGLSLREKIKREASK